MQTDSRGASDPRRQFLFELALISLLVILPIFIWIGRGDVENDEAIYSFASDMMLETGEWLTPIGIYDGKAPLLEKPPLKKWLVAAGLSFGLPDSNWGHRFIDAVFAAAIFCYLVAIGYRMGGRWAGFCSGLIFFTLREPFLDHGILSNNMESPLILQYVGSMFHFQAWIGQDNRSARHVIAIALLFVLGFMTKFVAALFLPLILLTVLLFHPRLLKRAFSKWPIWLGAGVLAFVLIAPWFIYQSLGFGQVFWDEIFGRHVVQRFVEHLDTAHLKPWYFYLVETLRTLAVSGAVVGILFGFVVLRRRYRQVRDPMMTSLIVWYLLPVAVMSVMTSKVTHYLYPFLPPLAIIAGAGTARLLTLRPGTIEEYYSWKWIRRTYAAFGWVRVHRWLIVLAILPVLVAYVILLNDMRTRPSPFSTLRACLDDIGAVTRVKAAYDHGRAAHHGFAYYGLLEYAGLDDAQLEDLVLGDRPEPVWLPPHRYRDRLLDNPPRWRSVEAHILSPALFFGGNGYIERGILLLPGDYAVCGGALREVGSKPVANAM